MATPKDAELILKLYELRTEPTMREARNFIATFNPANFDELLAVQRDQGSQNNAYFRQALSYWEMAAAFVLHGALDPELFNATNGESVYLYAKYTPYLEDYLKATGQPFMRQTAKLIETYPAFQQRYTMTLAMMEARRKRESAQG